MNRHFRTAVGVLAVLLAIAAVIATVLLTHGGSR